MKKRIEIYLDRDGFQVIDKQFKSRKRAVLNEGFIIDSKDGVIMSGCPVPRNREEALQMIAETLKQYVLNNFKQKD